eukprot:gene12593-3296_t
MSSDAQSNFLCFKSSLLIPPQHRSAKDVELIYRHLRKMQANSKLSDSTIRAMALKARYEVHDSNELLYMSDDWSFCWYILLSGSVFLDGCMYLPGSSFGKQSVQGKRGFDCLILEKSEMIVIDYPNEKMFKPYQRNSYSMQDLESLLALDADEVKFKESKEEDFEGHDRHSSKVSSSDSGYTEMDYRGSAHKSEQYDPRDREIDLNLSGLKETMVDSVDSDDEEDISSASESAAVRDIVRDCLEKDPSERTENDINILMDFVQHLPAFSKVSYNVRREMCAYMVFAVVEKAGSEVMIDGEEMDSWSVILNGSVEIFEKGKVPMTMHLGDCFGVNTKPEKVYHHGVMRTRVDDCQFVCIAREDYWRIFTHEEEKTVRVEEEGEVVLVTEHRTTDGGSREGQVVIKGMPDRLLDHLMEDHSTIDPTYVEDYLLTYVIFNFKPHELASKLVKWFDREQLKDKVTRVMLLWVNNHYCDFENDSFMERCIERFEYYLEAKKMIGQLQLLNMARSMKSTSRTLTLDRPYKDAKFDFSIMGGSEIGAGIFVSKVDIDSKAEVSGLKKGDQILEVNGQSLENVKLQTALDTFKSHFHLSLVVKNNIMGYKRVVDNWHKKKMQENNEDKFFKKPQFRDRTHGVTRSTSDTCDRQKPPDKNSNSAVFSISLDFNDKKAQQMKLVDLHVSGTYPGRVNARTHKDIRKKAMFSILPKSGSNQELNRIDLDADRIPFRNQSRIAESDMNDSLVEDCQVIKVHRALDQAFKYFIINTETTAQEVVIEAVGQFGITDTRGHPYFLCEVTVTEDGVIRQKRLTNLATDLANRIGLRSRYFIKNTLSDGGVTNEVAQDIAREGTTTFLQLSPLDVARELTLQDFNLFRSIDSREYIYNLFDSKSFGKFSNLGKFEKTANTEMFWVMREICSETNIVKRVKMIKRFIKVAKLCNDFKNYNSMFALLSGLDHSSVRRLKTTWEKVPAKYIKIFEDLKLLMDPSRNMSRYRNLFNGERAYPPLIPFFPIIKKDLTFLHLGNETYVDGLDPGKMDDVTQTSNGAPPSIAQSVVSVMTGQNTMTRKHRRTSSSMNNPKKAYEEALMSRKMRQYLEDLSNVATDENEIDRLSKACEQPTGSTQLSSLPKRRPLNMSPTPSKPSSTQEQSKKQYSPTPSEKREHEPSRQNKPEKLRPPDMDEIEEQVSIV